MSSRRKYSSSSSGSPLNESTQNRNNKDTRRMSGKKYG